MLNSVKGQAIESRNVIELGFVEVTYNNGVKVYVNYTGETQKFGNIEVPSMDYKVVS